MEGLSFRICVAKFHFRRNAIPQEAARRPVKKMKRKQYKHYKIGLAR